MPRHSHWNLIASGASKDVAIDIAKSMQYGDRYNVSIFIGKEELILQTRELDWIGTWLGMLSLEMGRSVDQSSEARGLQSDVLRLMRDPHTAGFQIEAELSGMRRVVVIREGQLESLRRSFEAALRELAAREH